MVIIDSKLTAPPSEVCLFRDITLFTQSFLQEKVVLECRREERDFYYNWLKNKAAWDYVEDFIQPESENGRISIRTKGGNITIDRINYQNINFILQRLGIWT